MLKEFLKITIALLILYAVAFIEQYFQGFDLDTYVISCIIGTIVVLVFYGYLLYKKYK